MLVGIAVGENDGLAVVLVDTEKRSTTDAGVAIIGTSLGKPCQQA